MLYFDQIDSKIGTSGIMCESASLQVENGLSPIYQLGRNGIVGQFPTEGAKASFGFNYLVELDNEPSYDIVNSIKQNLNSVSWTGVNITLGGITGYNCFLENYSLKASVNEPVKCSVSYISFGEVSGSLQNKTNARYNIRNNVAHGWTTFVTDSGNYLNTPTYEFNYSFKPNWLPNYIVGVKNPIQIGLGGIEETLSLERDTFLNVKYSGVSLTGMFASGTNNNFNIILMNIKTASGNNMQSTGYGALYFSIQNASVKNSSVSASSNGMVKTTTTAYRFY